MKQSKCHTCPKLKEQYVAMEQRQKLVDEISELRRNLSNENLQLMPEFQQRYDRLASPLVTHIMIAYHLVHTTCNLQGGCPAFPQLR
jgi:hypothetical protein